MASPKGDENPWSSENKKRDQFLTVNPVGLRCLPVVESAFPFFRREEEEVMTWNSWKE